MAPFIIFYKVVPTFASVDEILSYDHSKESYLLSKSTVSHFFTLRNFRFFLVLNLGILKSQRVKIKPPSRF